jgi:cytochrome c oxidase subunit II
MFDFMPEQASHWAAQVDAINSFITNTAIFFTVLLTGLAILFAIKYRRKSENQKTAFITHNSALEILWTVIPTIIIIFTFYYGFVTYKEMRTPPVNALEINVDAYSWRWQFQHPNGKTDINDLVVPVGRPVRLIMTSHDVLHSLFIPAMRVKEDVRGEVYSYTWFHPIKLGTFPIFCAEYCGLLHSKMIAYLRVVTEEEYQDYILERHDETVDLPPAELGMRVYAQQGCRDCHSIDGSSGIGPALQGIFAEGSERIMDDNTLVKVDENYVRESILNPKAKIVKGYNPIMPSYEGQLTEKELAGIISYLKTIE